MKDYVVNHPEDGEKIGRLRELMFEQVSFQRWKTLALLYQENCLAFVMIFNLEEINVNKPKCSDSLLQAHILEYGLAVHEKFVPQDMRPLHKKLVDQFHVMKSSLGIQVSEGHSTGAQSLTLKLTFIKPALAQP